MDTSGAANGGLDSTDYNQNVVASGDAAAGARTGMLNTVETLKQKKIPNDKRTTTPYLTKYERARVLGTRALQIRCVSCPERPCEISRPHPESEARNARSQADGQTA